VPLTKQEQTYMDGEFCVEGINEEEITHFALFAHYDPTIFETAVKE